MSLGNGKIEFFANLKQRGKPIKFGNAGDAEIILETSGSELASALQMVALTDQTFRVTIEFEVRKKPEPTEVPGAGS